MTIASRPSAFACSHTWLIRNRCPRCTPSKKPIVATQAVVFTGVPPSTYMVFIARAVYAPDVCGCARPGRQSYEETPTIARKISGVLPFRPCRRNGYSPMTPPCRAADAQALPLRFHVRLTAAAARVYDGRSNMCMAAVTMCVRRPSTGRHYSLKGKGAGPSLFKIQHVKIVRKPESGL